jgi:hypothetical protein
MSAAWRSSDSTMLPVTPAAHLQGRFFAGGVVIAVKSGASNRLGSFADSHVHTFTRVAPRY